MSRFTHSNTPRTIAVAGLLGLAGLASPAVTHGQTPSPERALLNSTPLVHFHAFTVASTPSRPVDGAQALLGTSTLHGASQLKLAISPSREARPVDGEQALLNKVALSPTRQLTLAL